MTDPKQAFENQKPPFKEEPQQNTDFKPDYLCNEADCKGRETYSATIIELHETIGELTKEVDELRKRHLIKPAPGEKTIEAMAKAHCEWNGEHWDDFLWSESLYEAMLDKVQEIAFGPTVNAEKGQI